MHFTSLLLLPLLVAADQVPLKEKAAGWFDKAKSYIPSAAPSVSVPVPPNPVEAGAATVAGYKVEKINIRNWQRKLAPKPDTEEEWMIYLTGGNKTCFGKCGPVDAVWNESVPLLAALPQPAGSPPLKLGMVDCEKDEVVCTAWASGVPVIYHFLLPKQSEQEAKTPLYIIPLNVTTTTVSDITSLPRASKSRYLEYDEYTGLMHPFDGLLAKTGLLQPFGYFMWALGTMPSWLMMLGISFISRQIMSRRMAGGRGIPAAADAQQPAAPRAAPAAPASQPKAGGGGSARKRK
ncbi:uncharacterized protein Z520_05152 [Fonsecaea multimorphosa CBS 102226]|uniref:Uncharacterized protein n=1 Tax=Fonsecaea multimorphosa CBS 102226 TaxID=1442371 RepID=A0A0D2IRD8_9EURO|nr:uncharacterized protein Z520_05152 [Fonsecaea multimorphosa CBS 102226]KIX99576.1 hypothetical protein Z520_05152 [Fonsecaea multimorphosa CBS 102226]OAL25567.1 hypothetical protein AYO22_04886 [Fonsecaea multimorphosa]